MPAYGALSLEGDTFDLADLRGQVVVLNAWATWCKPCVVELPMLQRLHENYQDQGLRVIGVSIDVTGGDKVARFLEDHGVTYTNLMGDDYELGRLFGWAPGVPRTLLIDKRGVLRAYWIGAFTREHTGDLHEAVTKIELLLKEKA